MVSWAFFVWSFIQKISNQNGNRMCFQFWMVFLFFVDKSSNVFPTEHFLAHVLCRFLFSRIPPVENDPFRLDFFSDWILAVLLLIVSRVDFVVFVLFLEAVGVREYCCTPVEIGWQLCASRLLREQRLGEPSSQRVGVFGLSRKPPKLRSWSCAQPRAAKATAAAAVVGSMGSRPRAAAVV